MALQLFVRELKNKYENVLNFEKFYVYKKINNNLLKYFFFKKIR